MFFDDCNRSCNIDWLAEQKQPSRGVLIKSLKNATEGENFQINLMLFICTTHQLYMTNAIDILNIKAFVGGNKIQVFLKTPKSMVVPSVRKHRS